MAYGSTSVASAMTSRVASSVLAARAAQLAKYGKTGAGGILGGGGGGGEEALSGERSAPLPSMYGEEEEGPFGLPLPVVIAGGVGLLAVVGLVVYKVKKRKK